MSNGVSVFTLITRTTMQYSICTMYMLLYVQPFFNRSLHEMDRTIASLVRISNQQYSF